MTNEELMDRYTADQLLDLGARIGTYLNDKRSKNRRYCRWTDELIICTLTVKDIIEKLDQANITVDAIGTTHVLGRHLDMGDYTVDSCRFMTHKENAIERARAEKFASLIREKVSREVD